MNQKHLLTAWGALFVLCAGLGFLPGLNEQLPQTLSTFLTLLSLGFFLPPAILVWQGRNRGDRQVLTLVRSLSALSLGLTAVCLCLNFLSVLAPQWVGDLSHYVLIVVSAPMVCSGQWALSLFLWACLLLTAKPKT